RIAWLYRYQGNNEKEMAFIKHARDKFIDAYQNENLSDDKENELLTMLLVGELSRRLSDYHTAVKWFSKLLQEPDIKKKRHIEMHARDLWAEASMAYKKEKGKDYEVDEE
ncbi:MAG: DUF2225 domain-containing protein, partial [Clostridia bacterium]|nr:DUF2225 domain-containing protein [Clostridia bacterium]